MRYLSIVGIAFAFALTANTVFAAEADSDSCHKLYSQVSYQLQDNSQSANHDQALKERNLGLQFCDHGFYKVGSDHLTAALRLLGAADSQAQAG